jgi:hypothetical protein
MKPVRARTLVLPLIAALVASSAMAGEIYQWVDENGVVNFSQTLPGPKAGAVNVLVLEQPGPPSDASTEDIYDVEGQRERMQALRDEMEERREARRERARQQPQVIYREPAGYAAPWYWGWPGYARPPARPPSKPRPPAPEPYETSTLRPLGRAGG